MRLRQAVRPWLVTIALVSVIAVDGAAQVTPPDERPAAVAAADPAGAWVRMRESRVAPLRRTVSLRLEQASLRSALDAIGRSARLQVVYGDDVLRAPARVTLRVDGMAVVDALAMVLEGTGLDAFVSVRGDALLVRSAVAVPAPTGAIVGRVTDAKTGAALAGAAIVVNGTSLGATAGTDGRYRIADVGPGTYTVRARYIGYAPATASVTVSADQEVTADFTLEKSAQRLDEVVTTGTLVPTEVRALPTPITVITAEDIERQHPRRFDELIRLVVPGAVVWESDAAGTTPATGLTISFRGVSALEGSSNPKIYIDGIEVAERSFLSVDPQSIERMEVLRGPQAAAIYGSDAMGGVIQIFTKRGSGARQRPELEIGAALGRIESSFPESGALRQEYTAGLNGRTGQASYRVGGGYRHTGAWVPHYGESTPSLQGGSRFEQGPLTLDLTTRFERAQTDLGFNPVYVTTGLDPQAVPSQTRTQQRFETWGLRIGYRPFWAWQHEATVGVDRFASTDVQLRPRRRTPDDTLLTVSGGEQQRLRFTYHTTLTAALRPGLAGTLTAGVDHYTSTSMGWGAFGAFTTLPIRVDPLLGGFSAGRSRTTNTGLFAQAQVSLRDALFLTGSVRGEDNSDFGADLRWPRSTKLGVTYARGVGTATVKLRMSYGQAIRAPSFGAKDSADIVPGLEVQLSNRNLRPERQRGPDAGVDVVFGHRGSLSVTYYDQTAKDFFFNQVGIVDDTITTFQVINVARVKNTGWEFEGTLDLGRVSARGNFAVTHSRPEDLGLIPPNPTLLVGQQMYGTPEHTGGLILSGSPLRRTSITVGVAYQGGWLAINTLELFQCLGGMSPCRPDFNYLERYPSVVKFNLSVDQELAHGISAYLSVEDLTNRSLRRAQVNTSAVPGRISTFGLRARF